MKKWLLLIVILVSLLLSSCSLFDDYQRQSDLQYKVEATRTALELEKMERDYQRDYYVTNISWGFLFVFLSTVMILFIYASLTFIHLKDKQYSTFSSDSNPIFWVKNRHGDSFFDPARMLFPSFSIFGKDVKHHDVVKEEIQTNIVERHQNIQLANRNRHSIIKEENRLPYEPRAFQSPLPPTADWNRVMNWGGKGYLVGVSGEGLITVDPDSDSSHVLIAGMTGAGKSRFSLRTMIASCLASGYKVTIMDQSGVDFTAFKNVENCDIRIVDSVSEIIDYLSMIKDEVIERLRFMEEHSISTIDRDTTGTLFREVIVLDELQSLIDSADKDEKRLLRSLIREISGRGRKCGFNLMIVVLNPVSGSFDLGIRRNFLIICHKVNDPSISRATVLEQGAERLQKGQILYRLFDKTKKALCFNPTDEQIRSFLLARGINVSYKNNTSKNRLYAPTPPSPSNLPPVVIDDRTFEQKNAERKEYIQNRFNELMEEGASINRIQEEIFGSVGGNNYYRVKKMVDDYNSNHVTDTNYE